jgi:hypothetical protein
MDLVWTCSCCGKQYDTLPFAFALDQPDPWAAVPPAERAQRGVLWTDSCVIDGRDHFIRGRIVIPVIGCDNPFIWGTWARVSQADFKRFGELWDVAIREQEPPFGAQLANDIPIYPATFGLNCRVALKNARRRPSFVLEPIEHPLAIEQRDGITLDRVKQIVASVMRHVP